MSDKPKLIYEKQLGEVSGGMINPDWSKGLKPRHEGEICPDCGVCSISFVQFQDYDGKREEVYYCPNCDYIKFTL